MAIALACDIRIAAESAIMTTGYSRIGLSGDYGIGWLQLRTSTHAAGYQVGTWAHEFRLVGTDGTGATVDQATAGCWP